MALEHESCPHMKALLSNKVSYQKSDGSKPHTARINAYEIATTWINIGPVVLGLANASSTGRFLYRLELCSQSETGGGDVPLP